MCHKEIDQVNNEVIKLMKDFILIEDELREKQKQNLNMMQISKDYLDLFIERFKHSF
jgi:transcriptional regulator of acetoin/glycerol metabolism